MKFLIVEDDPLSRELLRLNLADYGRSYEVYTGLLAIEAVRAAMQDSEPFDVVFLDIMLPGMDGHKILRALREVEKDSGKPDLRPAKMIMTTALNDPAHMMKAFQNGCDAYMVKPITDENLAREFTRLGLTTAAPSS